MAQLKLDGVIEAAHFSPSGELLWVRAYERRGATFSDCVILNRQELVQHIKAGKKFYVGQRKEFLSSTFQLAHPVHLVQHNSHDFLSSGTKRPGQDVLEGALFL